MKNCNEVMEEYLSLDKGERIPPGITLHLLACKRCRAQVRLLRRAERSSVPNPCDQTALDDDAILAVMKKITTKSDSQKNPISFSKWIVGGVIMALLFIAYSVFAKPGSNHFLTVYTYVELAALITAYCALFIRSNMDFFVKKINSKFEKKDGLAL
ncbi:MAG: hypothetical protein II814_07865 [Treponema sp.]|nr:hypothetical protein [Treponema sp.]